MLQFAMEEESDSEVDSQTRVRVPGGLTRLYDRIQSSWPDGAARLYDRIPTT